jgi:hypothetical protein
MKEALKGMDKLDFQAPPGTVFAQVGPNREAFQPGTVPHGPVAPLGSHGDSTPGQPNAEPNPAAPEKKPDELNGLF